MSLLKQIFNQEKPFWEKLFNQSELRAFYSAVSEHYKRQNRKFRIKNGQVIFQDNNDNIDLRNIAQSCQHTEKSQWGEIVESNLNQIDNIKGHVFDIGNRPFSEIADLLAVRVWPHGSLQSIGAENLLFREDLEGTVSIVALDLPDSIQSVTPQMALAWGKTKDELFNVGFENVFSRHIPDIGEVDLANGTIKAITLSKTDDYLTTTHIFFIDKYPGCVGKYGALLGIPLRDAVVCYPVNNGQIKKEIAILLLTVRNVFHKGPGSVSPYLYWYHENRFETVHYIEKENRFVLPNQLLGIMEAYSKTDELHFDN